MQNFREKFKLESKTPEPELYIHTIIHICSNILGQLCCSAMDSWCVFGSDFVCDKRGNSWMSVLLWNVQDSLTFPVSEFLSHWIWSLEIKRFIPLSVKNGLNPISDARQGIGFHHAIAPWIIASTRTSSIYNKEQNTCIQWVMGVRHKAVPEHQSNTMFDWMSLR